MWVRKFESGQTFSDKGGGEAFWNGGSKWQHHGRLFPLLSKTIKFHEVYEFHICMKYFPVKACISFPPRFLTVHLVLFRLLELASMQKKVVMLDAL